MLDDLIEMLTHRKQKKFEREVKEGKWVLWGGWAVLKEDVENGRVILSTKQNP